MPVTTRHRPTTRTALAELRAAVEAGDLAVVLGRCTVEYDGRAASSLGPGDRLVVLKPDGTALVHTDEGRTPVNWQPPGAEHRAAVRDGRLCVVSERSTPDERLTVSFEAVYQVTRMDATDAEDLELRGSEADLRERLLAEPALVEPGFEPLDTERPTDAGPIDLFGRDADGAPVVVELKRRRVGPSAVSQLRRYVAAVRREEGLDPDGTDGAVRGILVAPSLTDRARDLLDERGLEFVALDAGADAEPDADAPEGGEGTAGDADDGTPARDSGGPDDADGSAGDDATGVTGDGDAT
jgi:hypothetical protein